MKIRVIVNPKAGAGAAARKVAAVEAALRRAGVTHEVAVTTARGDATVLARRAREDGVDVIAVVGGDGTMNEVSQAYVDTEGSPLPGPDIALVPAGTGGDFRRSYDLGKDASQAVSRMLSAAPRPLDLGVMEFTGDDGRRARRAFVNIGSFGVSGKLDRLVDGGPKWLGGTAAFALATARALATYKNAPVSIRVDGQSWYEGRVVAGVIANGQYFGGGMHVAPDADPADGLLDVVVIGDFTLPQIAAQVRHLYAGTHLSLPLVKATRGKIIEAAPLDGRKVLIDCDGETPGELPLKAWVLPAALRIRA